MLSSVWEQTISISQGNKILRMIPASKSLIDVRFKMVTGASPCFIRVVFPTVTRYSAFSNSRHSQKQKRNK